MTSDLLTQSNTDCSCISVEKLTYHKWFTVSAAVAWIRRVAWHAQTPPPPPELMETAGIWRQTGANGQRKSKASQHIAFIVDDFITALLFFSFNSFVFCFYVLFFFSFVCLFVCIRRSLVPRHVSLRAAVDVTNSDEFEFLFFTERQRSSWNGRVESSTLHFVID